MSLTASALTQIQLEWNVFKICQEMKKKLVIRKMVEPETGNKRNVHTVELHRRRYPQLASELRCVLLWCVDWTTGGGRTGTSLYEGVVRS